MGDIPEFLGELSILFVLPVIHVSVVLRDPIFHFWLGYSYVRESLNVVCYGCMVHDCSGTTLIVHGTLLFVLATSRV